MLKFLKCVLVLFLTGGAFYNANAQGGYIEESIWSNLNAFSGIPSDFIITNTGEKVFGDVITAYDFANYDKIDFEINGVVTTFLPSEIKAFGLENGRFFMSKKLPESAELEYVQVLFSGRLQLDFKKGKYYIDYGTGIQELKSYYQDVPGAGSPRKRYVKLYISTLKILTAGICGQSITDLIERSKLEEQDFIQILTQYHECEKLPYKLHVVKIPLVKISPTVGVGFGSLLVSSYDNDKGRASKIDKPFNFEGELGIRFHDFRKSPRITLDLSMAYSWMSAEWELSESNSAGLFTGSQNFKQQVISIPFSLNYSFFRKDDLDVYLGMKAGLRYNSMKAEVGSVDLTIKQVDETFLSDMMIMDAEKILFVPGIKLGANWPLQSKMGLYTELNADYARKAYMTYLPVNNEVGYNAFYVSLKIGVEF